MTVFMCSLFYIYVVYAINYYRKEINYRLDAGHTSKSIIKIKAPFSFKKSVLLSFSAILINIILQLIFDLEILILINAIPVCTCMLILRKYEKILIKLDKE